MHQTITQETEALIPNKPKRKRRSEETRQIAWFVLVTAFVIFCTLCVTSSFGVYYFLFQSNTTASASVKVSNRGTVGLVSADFRERFEFDSEFLSRGDTVLTDPQSQAVVSFRNTAPPNSGGRGQVFASITLKNDSELVVNRMTQPRFDWSGRSYEVLVEGKRGEFDIFVPDNIQRRVDMMFLLPHNTAAHIGEPGRYTLHMTDTAVRLETRHGQAALLPPDRANNRLVTAGQVGIYDVEQSAVFITAGYRELIENSAFFEFPESEETAEMSLPAIEAWNCADRADQNPPGDFRWEIFEGRPTFHFIRGDGAESHGETTCIQPFGPSAQVGRPVADYDYLALRATFYIRSHSLNLCGTQGSECPLMLRIDYVDTNGAPHRWYQGFYAKLEGAGDYPPQCVSCLQEHKRVNANAWYTYESGNLFTLLPQDRKPASILNVRFYASGHEYDVYVSEMSLLAGPASDEAMAAAN